jgi:hypothetical protein
MRGAARLAATLAAVAALVRAAAADEAVRADGRQVVGALAWSDGRLRFAPRGGGDLPLSEIVSVRFAGRPEPFRTAGGRRVVLTNGDALSGRLLGLDGERLLLQSAWAERLAIPRSAVAAVTHLPGWQVLVEEAGPGPGKFSRVIQTPVRAGRVAVNFAVDGKPGGSRELIAVRFADGKEGQTLRVGVSEAGAYTVVADGLPGGPAAAALTPGWHRLTVGFAPHSLRVSSDDAVLWHSLAAGPRGGLAHVALGGARGTTGGPVRFAAFELAAAVEETPRPPGDATQDELWLADGDQLFGAVPRADLRGVSLRAAFGERTYPWADLRGLFLHRSHAAPPAQRGAARVWLDGGLGSVPDELSGEVTGFDDKALTLRHVVLGEVRVERARLRRLRPGAGP